MRASQRTGAVTALLLALLLGVLGAAFGWTVSERAQRTHSATAVVLLTPLEGNPFNPDAREGVLSLETEARLVTSDAVSRVVAAETGGEITSLQSSVSVEVPPNTQLLRITVEDEDEARAVVVADSFAAEFLDYRATRTKAAVFDRRAHLREEVRTARGELAGLTRQQRRLEPDSAERILVDQQVSAAAVQVSQLQSELAALGYVSEDPGQVVTPAQVAAPGLLGRPFLGAAVGGVLGVAVVLGTLVLRRGRTVGSALDLTTAGHDVLGHADAPDGVRARLLLAHPDRPLTLLLAEPSGTGQAAPLAAAFADDLATAFARAHLTTVHVRLAPVAPQEADPDADVRVAPGLEEVLLGKADIDEVLHTERECLATLTPTTEPLREPWGDLLASPALGNLLADLRERAEIIVISAATLPGAPGELLLAHADHVLVRAVGRSTRARDLDLALEAAAAGPAAVGVVHDVRRRAPRAEVVAR